MMVKSETERREKSHYYLNIESKIHRLQQENVDKWF